MLKPNEYKYVWELLLSLNKGNCREAESRVDIALKQYEEFKKKTGYGVGKNEN